MRKVVINDGDVLTPLGNLSSTWRGLVVGSSGISLTGFEGLKGEWPLGLIPGVHGALGSYERLQSTFDLLFDRLPTLPTDTRLICATTKGAVDELISQSNQVKGQPWQIDSELATRLGIQEKPLTVSAACASGTLAIINGAMMIANGECDHVLVVGFDLLARFVLTGFDSLKALSAQGAKPFDKNRDGLSLGDGAGWLLLSAEECVLPSKNPLAYLESWAVTCDATHITAPCRNGSGLIAALKQITKNSNKEIGGINAHGTGTVYNDAMELLAFSSLCEQDMPICSVKGALGHSLGAAGVIETLISVRSLEHNILPPTVGLSTASESSCKLSGDDSLQLLHPTVLTCNSGFGGINAGILLAKNR